MNETKQTISLDRKTVFREGIRDGIPIGLGYLAVSFSLGIAAKRAGLTPFQVFLVSILNNASAGEYAGFSMIEANAAYIEIALITLIANARYLLMSFSISQRFDSKTSIIHRILVGYDLTDEIFGISIARPGFVDPIYNYGAIIVAAPCWAGGTALGIIAGNVLPFRVVSALSVALYGMFLAIIIPPAKHNKVIGVLVIISFIASYAASHMALFSAMSSGTRTILLTVIISAVAAILFPKIPYKGE